MKKILLLLTAAVLALGSSGATPTGHKSKSGAACPPCPLCPAGHTCHK